MNTTRGEKERATRVLRVHANHHEEVEEVPAGHLAALVGLKVHARLGSGALGLCWPALRQVRQVLTTRRLSASRRKREAARRSLTPKATRCKAVQPAMSWKPTPDPMSACALNTPFHLPLHAPAVLKGIDVPEPVFSISIEPESLKDQVRWMRGQETRVALCRAHCCPAVPPPQVTLDQALANLQREDNSLRVQVDDDTGQTVLSGTPAVERKSSLYLAAAWPLRTDSRPCRHGGAALGNCAVTAQGRVQGRAPDEYVGSRGWSVRRNQPGLTHTHFPPGPLKVAYRERAGKDVARFAHSVKKEMSGLTFVSLCLLLRSGGSAPLHADASSRPRRPRRTLALCATVMTRRATLLSLLSTWRKCLLAVRARPWAPGEAGPALAALPLRGLPLTCLLPPATPASREPKRGAVQGGGGGRPGQPAAGPEDGLPAGADVGCHCTWLCTLPWRGGRVSFIFFSFFRSGSSPLQTRKSSSSQRFISIQNALDVPAEAPPGLAALVVSDAIRRAMQKAEVQLLQPVMRLEVIAEDGDVGAVTTDIRCRLGRACALLRCLLQVGHG